jgi:hypothetical protein
MKKKPLMNRGAFFILFDQHYPGIQDISSGEHPYKIGTAWLLNGLGPLVVWAFFVG